MESMGKKRRPRRAFTPEFKAEIVEVCRRGDRSVGQVAKDFDLTETAVRDWVSQADLDAGVRTDGLTSDRAGGTGAAAAGEPPAARGRGDPQAGHGFLREGDPVNVYPFIEAEKSQQHNVKRACELLKVSRSAFYADRDRRPVPARARRRRAHRGDRRRARRVRAAPTGRRGSTPSWPTQGRRHGRKRIARLMRAAGRRGRAPQRWRTTTIPDPAAAAAADLIGRDFATATTALDARWCGDITYIHTWEGWLYLATVIDLARAASSAGPPPTTCAPTWSTQALTDAVASRRPHPG